MESRRWVIAAFAALAALSLACTGSGSQPSSSALPVTTLTPTASVRTTGTAPAGATGVSGTPVRPAAGVPLAPSTPPGAAPATAPAGALLLQQQGVGTNQAPTVELQTQTFIAPGAWDLQWRYDCSALGRAGNLSIDVFRGDGGYVNNPPSLAQLGNGGQGVANYAIGGPLYLVINSVCAWSVTAVTAARPTSTPSGTGSVPAGAAGASAAGPAAAATAAPVVAGIATPLGATPAPAQQGGGSAPAAATATAVPTATATSTPASGATGGINVLEGGRPIITSPIGTPISAIEQAQGVFAIPSGLGAPRATAPSALPTVTQATPLPVAVTVAPAGSP